MCPLLSVVLPIHNMEAFLPKTLELLTINQFSEADVDCWELIIVDDGSTDTSYHIATAFAKKHYPLNITVIRTENHGVGQARNTALNAAKGEYVFFADGDDIISKNSLLPICEQISGSNTDILHFQYKTISTDRYSHLIDYTPEVSIPQAEINDVKAFAEKTIGCTQPHSQWAVWQNIYRRKFLIDNRIVFSKELTIGEDAVFFWQTMMYARHLRCLSALVYFYHQRKDSAFYSALTISNTKARLDYIDAMTRIIPELVSNGFGAQTLFGINCNLRETARQIITEGIIGNLISIRQCWYYLRRLQKCGLCRTGLTRFHPKPKRTSLRQHIYRISLAYILIPLVRIIY